MPGQWWPEVDPEAPPEPVAELDVVVEVVVLVVSAAGVAVRTAGVELAFVLVEVAALASATPPPASEPMTTSAASDLVNLFFIRIKPPLWVPPQSARRPSELCRRR